MKSEILCLMTLLFQSCVAGQEPGPIVNGRPVSFWLLTWAERTTNSSQRAAAESAFMQAGTNIIPYLLNELTAGDIAEKSGACSVEDVRQAIQRSIAAEAALRFMGPCVTSAIPELTKLMALTNYGAVKAAAEVLACLGPPGIHALVFGLSNTNSEAREAIPRVLRNMGTNILVEVPVLLSNLEGLPTDAALDCSYAIVQSGTAVGRLVAEFTRCLESTNPVTRYVSARRLGELGTNASGAISGLERRRSDSDKDVRNAADWALRRIRKSVRPDDGGKL